MSSRTGHGSPMGGRIQLIVGIAVSVGCLGLLLWNIEWDLFLRSLQGASYVWLIPALGCIAISVWFKAIKWQLLLRPAGYSSQKDLVYAICVGYLVNTVLPGRLGELARVFMVSKLDKTPVGAVISTVAVDRIIDAVAMAILLAIALPTADLPATVGELGLLVGLAGIAVLAVCVALAYPWGRSLFMRLLSALPRFPGKGFIEKFAESLFLGMEGLKGAAAVAKIVAVTVVIWGMTFAAFCFGMAAFHIQAPLWAAAMVVAITNLGMVVPSSPGYVGVYHGLVVLAMAPYGVDKEIALGYGTVIHLLWIVPVGIVGAFALWRRGMNLMSWRTAEGEPSGSPSMDPVSSSK